MSKPACGQGPLFMDPDADALRAHVRDVMLTALARLRASRDGDPHERRAVRV